MFQSDNLGHGNPRDDLRPAALISLVAEDRLHSNGHEATRSRKKESTVLGVPSGRQQICAGSWHKF